jgi:PAS domain S-box-containing protein
MSNNNTYKTTELARRLELALEENKRLQTLIDSEGRGKTFSDAAEELEDSKEKYRDIFHNSQVGLARTRASDGEFLEANDRMATMLGYKNRLELLDEFYSASVYKYPQDRKYMIETIKEYGEINDFEVNIYKKDGADIWVRYSAKLYPDEGYLDVVVIDITNEKKAEKEKEHLYKQLAQSQKMEAVGRLSSGIAHDFNNLLTVIKTMAYKSKKEVDVRSKLHKYITLIDTAAEGAKNLTQKLLIFSKKQSTSYTTLNINNIISNLQEILQSLIGSNITIDFELAEDILPIHGDKVSFEQIIVNLAINARDAMPGGGTLKIKTENIDDDAVENNKLVSITIADNGTGMDKETERRIFEPFFTSKPPGEGTGLGASVVYGIVKDHMGSIDINTTPGEGTSISVVFTASSELGAPTEKKVMDAPLYLTGKGEKILMVEDHELISKTTTLLLTDNGYEVTVAPSAEQALILFEEKAGGFDFLLSDVVLPGQSGVELANLILSKNPELPILLCSGYTSKKLQWEEIQEKELPFIKKPYDSTELLQMIKQGLLRAASKKRDKEEPPISAKDN